MSCGHAVTPESLTAWCRSLLDQVLWTPPCDLIQLKCCVAPPQHCCGANMEAFIAMWDVICIERVSNGLKSEARGKSSPGEPDSSQVFPTSRHCFHFSSWVDAKSGLNLALVDWICWHNVTCVCNFRASISSGVLR